MLKRIPSNLFNWILLITLAILLFELMFFEAGFIFTALFLLFLIFLGWKNYDTLVGKILFWVGIVSLVLNILNLYAVRFLFLAFIFLFFRDYMRSKNDPESIKPEVSAGGAETETAGVLKELEPLFQHRFFGDQKTANEPYQWRDINIHGGFGDRVIDLSNTVIQDNAVVSIRHGAGNITIYIPYEVEVSVYHSTMFGRISIFQSLEKKIINRSVAFQTENYQQGHPRVKIITSIFSGDIEVRRI